MLDVAVVMPVYNEAECIADVLHDWMHELDRVGIHYRLLVLNDGSRDNTAVVLQQFESSPAVTVINKENSGHGPTIRMGYELACREANWVFQVDSDNEINAEQFQKLWAAREGCAAVIGIRDGRQQPPSRKAISFCSRWVVRLFYGSGIVDVNCPFRLMRAEVLQRMLRYIPENTFAPNVGIAGLLARAKVQVLNIPVSHRNRRTGEVSIKKWKLAKAAMKSLAQIIAIRCRIPRGDRL
jgi:glycosyltransferase involved in cell wall biosynthesis